MKHLVLLCLLTGCLKVPEIVLVDRATALEQQAGGSFEALERKLVRTGIAPRPVPLTPDELESLGMSAAPVDPSDKGDPETTDGLLRQHCLGEANDGFLVDTPTACRGAPDRAELIAVVDRTNHARAQLWRWTQERNPDQKMADIRKRWTQVHLSGVVCGGWFQREDGTWDEKKC